MTHGDAGYGGRGRRGSRDAVRSGAIAARRRAAPGIVAVIAAVGCAKVDVVPEFVLKRPSKSGTIAISADDRFVAMVNPDRDVVEVYETPFEGRPVRSIPSGGIGPSGIVIHPDGVTAYVANRGSGTVTAIDLEQDAPPAPEDALAVGSEPIGLALSPTGRRLFVAAHAEGRVTVIDTEEWSVITSLEEPRRPRALAVTNDGDKDDRDELLVVPEFFGERGPGPEGADDSRTGRVWIYRVGDLSHVATVAIPPFTTTAGDTDAPLLASPNQLWAAAIQGNDVFLPTISVSPVGPNVPGLAVRPIVHVLGLASLAPRPEAGVTLDLAAELQRRFPGTPTLKLADLVDFDFVGTIGYAVSRGAATVQRIDYTQVPATLGSQFNAQIDVGQPAVDGSPPCELPTGIVTNGKGTLAFLSCWGNARMGVIELPAQALRRTLDATGPTEDARLVRGRRSFFTARGRWAREGWSSCGSCHPDGRSDQVTWRFATGPRRTPSLAGSFFGGPGARVQRVFNWTATFDEVHDFERHVRQVSGGLGAITTPDPTVAAAACGAPGQEVPQPLADGLGAPVRALQDTPGNCSRDWDDVEAWLRTIRPPRGRTFLDPEAVARGRVLFGEPSPGVSAGGCVRCHGGPGWTASRLFFMPDATTNQTLDETLFAPPPAWPATWNAYDEHIQPEQQGGPLQLACVLRDVNTYGIPDDPAATAALEVDEKGDPARGAGGFNVPSLIGLSVGGPFLHHGQVDDLEQLLGDPRWRDHARAGNPVFLTTGDVEAQRAALVAFLLSIDGETRPEPIPPAFEGCPRSFP